MKLGQHFLVDERIAERQIEYAQLNPHDTVLEIGAGNGILTKRMARISKVIAIEIDRRFIESLERIPNVEVIHADATKVDFNSLDFNKVVSNLPYQISSPVTFKLLETSFEKAILMYQKEFAARLIASPGSKDYSRLTVMVAPKAKVRVLEEVPRWAFKPVPKVSSCIVEMVPSEMDIGIDYETFGKVVTALFSHRRKKIKNAMVMASMVRKEDADDVPYGDERVEHLDVNQVAEIARFWRGYVEKDKKTV
ncbi:MAG: ribosomal RNA small subunit methyltransferase A [Thermoplasmata archaeon]|nr:ribosomal RNA small subunit methyltransferase A [Thermoplasmata archaeon]